MMVTVMDDSVADPDSGLNVLFFRTEMDQLPAVCNEGDIVQFRHLKVSRSNVNNSMDGLDSDVSNHSAGNVYQMDPLYSVCQRT